VIVTKSDTMLDWSLELSRKYTQGFFDIEYGLRDFLYILLCRNVAVNGIMLKQLLIEKCVKSVTVSGEQRGFFLVLNLLCNFHAH